MTPRARLGHVTALDGVRGVAISLVLLHHITRVLPSTFLGVQAFFVLSGFLITTLLLEENVESGRLSLSRFYRRRALRLFPALWTVLLGYLTLALAAGRPTFGTALRGVGLGLVYVTNIVESLSATLVPVSVGHLWSLATEEQFYLLWPPVLVLALRARTNPGFLVRALLAAAFVVAVNRSVLSALGFGWRRVYYAPDSTFDAILIGCALGVAFCAGMLDQVDKVKQRGRLCMLVLPFLLMLSASATYDLGMLLFELCVAAVLASVVTGADVRIARALSAWPLRWLGRISYGVYLWNWIIVQETPMKGVAGAAVSIVIAAGSYRWIEMPFLRRRHRQRPLGSSEAAVGLSPAV